MNDEGTSVLNVRWSISMLGDSRRAIIGNDIPAEFLGIVLAGGASQMPQTKKGIEARFPQFVGKITLGDPNHDAAKGAAYFCKMSDDN